MALRLPITKFAVHTKLNRTNPPIPMKDKIQVTLLSVIAIALVAIAIGLFTGDKDSKPETSLVAASNTTAKPVAATTGETFDPLAQTEAPVDNTPKTTVNFAEYEHDFGNIKQDTENEKVFTFTNTGTEPLIIESATGSCGCTVPEYPKHPIAPGETGDIKVVYKPGKQKNAQTKTVTIVANTEPKSTELRIKANVEEVAG